jgi:hypothetical protein
MNNNFTSIKEKCLNRLHEFGTGHGTSVASKMLGCLFNQFVRNVLVEDIDDFKSIEGKPFMYLANHQTGIESLVINGISLEKSQYIMAVAKKELSSSVNDVGVLARLYYSHGEAERRSSGLFFIDRESPLTILSRIKELMERIIKENIACLVHLDGTRAVSCHEETKNVNSVIIDEAVRLDIPLVPLRMTGGLPFEGDRKLDYPVNAGKQDYWIGKSIRSAMLKPMNLKERKDYILGKLNSLGNECGPIIKTSIFANLVKSYQEKYGFSDFMAHVYMALESGNKDSQIKALVEYLSGRSDTLPFDADKKAWYQTLKESFFAMIPETETS